MSGPPPSHAIYRTPDGLEFWMDYRDSGAPYDAPTIRTEDPDIWICFMPPVFRSTEAFLFGCDGGRWIFARPDASSIMDTSAFEDLDKRNPHLDMALSEMLDSFTWFDRKHDSVTPYEITADTGFRSREQQDHVTGLFCDLMAWIPLNGPIAMAHGGWRNSDRRIRPGLVGFDKPLQRLLDQGAFIDL